MNSAPFPFCGAVEKLRGLVHSPIDDDDGAANERNANFLPVSLQVMADTERNIAKFLFQEGAVLERGEIMWIYHLSVVVASEAG